MDRRKFCLSSAAITTGIAAGRVLSFPAAPPVELHHVVVDKRFSAARAFAAAVEAPERPAAAIEGDVTALWLNDLRPRWQRGAAVVGMTSARSLFCLEQLAHDQWMRVAVRAEHRVLAGGAVLHRLSAGESLLARLGGCFGSGMWPAHLAQLLASLALGEPGGPAQRDVRGARHGVELPRDAQLVSWVIAGEAA
jgi:hypothetical protein